MDECIEKKCVMDIVMRFTAPSTEIGYQKVLA